MSAPRLSRVHAEAAATYFNDDHAFFLRYRRDCLQQFALDRQAGQALIASGDLPGLLHLGHSLKTVLALVGEPDAAAFARVLEQVARASDGAAAVAAWENLARQLDTVLTASPDPTPKGDAVP